jgi:hypothetical protein
MPAADRPIRLALAACLAFAAPVAVAAAEPEPGFAWMVNQYEGNASLVYGSTETGEDYSFFVSCNNQEKEAEITVYQDIEGAKVGEPLTIELSAGSAEVALMGETATDEMSGFVFGVAKKIAVKPVIAVLSKPGPAIVKMGKVTVNLPETGRAAAVSEFAKACKLD